MARPVGMQIKSKDHIPKKQKPLETDADQLRIKREIDDRYAVSPDLGRVIERGSDEFIRISAELLARENKGLEVVMSAKGVCKECGKGVVSLPARGLCSVCYAAVRKAEDLKPIPKPKPVPKVKASDVPVSDDFGKVKNVAGDLVSFGVDQVILEALRDAFEAELQKESAAARLAYAARERELLPLLSGLSAGKAVCYTARIIEKFEAACQ